MDVCSYMCFRTRRGWAYSVNVCTCALFTGTVRVPGHVPGHRTLTELLDAFAARI